MPITVATIEAYLVGRNGGQLGACWSEVGLDASTIDGTNPDLLGPLAKAARDCSLSMVDFSILQDVDLDSIHSTQYEKLLDMAEYRCLEKVLNNCVKVDEAVSGYSKSFNQFRMGIKERLAEKLAYVKATYGLGVAKLTTGTIRLNFAERSPVDPGAMDGV
jgi:hypothetical protein